MKVSNSDLDGYIDEAVLSFTNEQIIRLKQAVERWPKTMTRELENAAQDIWAFRSIQSPSTSQVAVSLNDFVVAVNYLRERFVDPMKSLDKHAWDRMISAYSMPTIIEETPAEPVPGTISRFSARRKLMKGLKSLERLSLNIAVAAKETKPKPDKNRPSITLIRYATHRLIEAYEHATAAPFPSRRDGGGQGAHKLVISATSMLLKIKCEAAEGALYRVREIQATRRKRTQPPRRGLSQTLA